MDEEKNEKNIDLLSSLLEEAEKEAEQEKRIIIDKIKKKEIDEQKLREEEERKRRELLKKKLEEETRRRHELLKKKLKPSENVITIEEKRPFQEVTKKEKHEIKKKINLYALYATIFIIILLIAYALFLNIKFKSQPQNLKSFAVLLKNSVEIPYQKALLKEMSIENENLKKKIEDISIKEYKFLDEINNLKNQIREKDQIISEYEKRSQVKSLTERKTEQKKPKELKIDTSIFKLPEN